MKTRIGIFFAGIALTLLTALALTPISSAQVQSIPNGSNQSPMGARGSGPQMGNSDSLITVTANVLKMEQTALVAELQGGKTIAQVAKEHNVALDTIIEAFLAPRAEWLAAMVADGRMSQAQADTMLATMRTHVTDRMNASWTPQGNGNGLGFTDADGDGVCDHAGSCPGCPSHGNRRGRRGR